jgi:hypothetical protein
LTIVSLPNGGVQVGAVARGCFSAVADGEGPHTTLVGAEEFGYDDERPIYKRKPKKMRTASFRTQRAPRPMT